MPAAITSPTIDALPVTQTLSQVISRLTACCWSTASLSRDEIAAIAAGARAHSQAPVLLTSCQRLEVYGFDECNCGAPVRFTGTNALRHISEVAAGLHSLVLGESEILGQLRAAFAGASPEMREAGDIAVAAARELRRQTVFNSHSGHMLDRALSQSGVEPGGTALVVGAGAIGRLIAVRAKDLGFEHVVVAARRPPDAEWFSHGGFEYRPLSALAHSEAVDIAIGCLGSSAGELDPRTDLPEVRRLIVDLGTPRNFGASSAVRTIAIAAMLEADRQRPHSAARREALRTQLHGLIDRRVAMASVTGKSPVGQLRASVEAARLSEVARILQLHPEIPRETIDAITRSFINRVLHTPSERLKALGDDELAQALANLFAPIAGDGEQ